MEINKLRQLDDKKLGAELTAAEVSLHKLLAERAMMTLKDTSQLRKAKKAIAYISTVINERKQLAAFDAPKETPSDK